MTLGDHLWADNVGCWLIGKTHMKADAKGMARLGLSPDSVIGARRTDDTTIIIYDPRAEADATRGKTCDALVEAIDITATIIAAAGSEIPDHIVEGRSLLPYFTTQNHPNLRDFVISEYDYSSHPACAGLGVSAPDARLFMVANHEWKMIYCEGPFRPMLFDLTADPDELADLGGDPAYTKQRDTMYAHRHKWARRMAQRVTISNTEIDAKRKKGGKTGVVLGHYDGTEADPTLSAGYKGISPARRTD